MVQKNPGSLKGEFRWTVDDCYHLQCRLPAAGSIQQTFHWRPHDEVGRRLDVPYRKALHRQELEEEDKKPTYGLLMMCDLFIYR